MWREHKIENGIDGLISLSVRLSLPSHLLMRIITHLDRCKDRCEWLGNDKTPVEIK